ncbi:MAG: AMP-binding protein [Rhodocyclaceae bacterium]|jgi:long-chain acyl-CoA synthetase|nr:AMP-binding protein [Rhodocyclaceae bacterium]MBK6905848.1 AMP-binding protein [Rhodocyclaceae bacterium]
MSDAVKSPLEMFYKWEKETPEKVFLRQPKALKWAEFTWAQVGDQARRVASYIRAQGYPAGSSIGIWSGNSMDWVVVDLAIMMSGHISIPVYPGQDIESAQYILEHSATRMIFLGSFDQAAKADSVIPAGMTKISMIGCTTPCDISLADVIAQNEPIKDSPVPDLDSVFTMVYTSGTTGNPKGVMHVHGTAGYTIPATLKKLVAKDPMPRYFSFLPLSHIAERVVVEISCLYSNGTISFSEGLATFAEELRSVQPTLFFAVPRLWLKFKEGVDAKVPPAMQAHLNEEQKAGIRAMLGLSKATTILTGSAPCPKDVQQWFIDMGMWLRDGYGMTENFIDGCGWNSDEPPLPGCVGTPWGTAEVKISDAGEILFRSKGVMKGYYKEPEKTAEVIDGEGWYHSGDSGRIDENGNLWITGRISEVFKTTKGKFIKPIGLEGLFGRTELLAQFCVCGHGLDQPILLTTLSEIGKKADRAELTAKLEGVLKEINADLPPYERINQMFIAKEEWQIGNGLLTPTMKLKRKTIEGQYRPWVEQNIGKAAVVFE